MNKLFQPGKLLFPLLMAVGLAAFSATSLTAQTFSATNANADSCYSLPQFAGHALFLPGSFDGASVGTPDGSLRFLFSSPGSFVESGTTATLTGTVFNAADGTGFQLNVTFTGRQFPPVEHDGRNTGAQSL